MTNKTPQSETASDTAGPATVHDGIETSRVQQLEAEVERLRADVAWRDRQIDGATTEVERLLAALTRFGRHELLCSFFKDGPHQASPETICDCGLNAALKA
jgi:hypothetical protein